MDFCPKTKYDTELPPRTHPCSLPFFDRCDSLRALSSALGCRGSCQWCSGPPNMTRDGMSNACLNVVFSTAGSLIRSILLVSFVVVYVVYLTWNIHRMLKGFIIEKRGPSIVQPTVHCFGGFVQLLGSRWDFVNWQGK